MLRIPIIDSHTGGEPTRVVLSGVTADRLETYRRAIICEPRGHEVIVGALLVEPKDATCAAGVIFFNNVGLLGMCGHGMIGLIGTLKHLGRISAGEHRVETPVGIVTATLHDDGRVSIRNVTAYRQAKAVKAGGVTGDVAWGGNWFFLVSDHGLELTLQNVPQLTQASLAMREVVRAAGYPEVDHVELFAPPHEAANHSRNFVLCPGGEYDRSPCGTGTSAKLACLAADGKLSPGEVWRQESILGSVFEGSYEATIDGIIPTITGQAYITAESTLILDPNDPFQFGFA
ncbi:proline racemase family protein [Prosthecobacter sp.]|uniref:proline racemase family protein n=1 Tax=Prosthecobacter sp. TaxID=1965333 RepID=UPI002AB7FCD8|nr:proline racemase family protein [Prosthecobacter sp.]MDZ4401016.1 proline racemase family protein [Prosthecobacter sp.]